MELYDGFIAQIKKLTASMPCKIEKFSSGKLKKSDKNSVIFAKDSAFELGGGNKKCVSTLALTSKMSFDNTVQIIGSDIPEIKSDCSFAKIVLLEIDDIEEETAFDKIKKLEHVRYQISVEGFMSRASALSMREQIRVSKKAVKDKITFSDYASTLISEYLSFPIVKSAQIIIITDDGFDYDALLSVAEKIKDTTSALNHILDNILFDCKSCNLKEICDEVEGMKELHMRQVKR